MVLPLTSGDKLSIRDVLMLNYRMVRLCAHWQVAWYEQLYTAAEYIQRISFYESTRTGYAAD
jgi:hypothetical protein